MIDAILSLNKNLDIMGTYKDISKPSGGDFVLSKSSTYQEFLAEREEIMRHKWLESEKAGHDIGFEKALMDWAVNHREKWRIARRKKKVSA